MAWNEPGGGGDRDPWGGGKNDKGPPDIDEVVKKMQEKFGGLFGGKKSNGSGGGVQLPKGLIHIVIIVVLVIWGAVGFYTVEEGKNGVVTTFGAYSGLTKSGLQWLAVPFQKVQLVDIQKIHSTEIGYRSSGRSDNTSIPKEANMLTEDENIIDIRLAVQYKINNPRDYLFNVVDPNGVLKQATESAIRHVVGQSRMDYILKEGRAKVASDAQDILQKTLNSYHAGLDVVQVTMQDAQPPEQVQHAFTDAVKAQEDRERLINHAEAYQKDILPRANGLAARQVEEAIGYKAKTIAESKGESDRFLKILVEFEKAPEITRERLYLDSMESVLSNSSKVLIDVDSGNSLMYLPLDKMVSNAATQVQQPAALPTQAPQGVVEHNRPVTQQESRTSSRRTRIRGFQ